MSGIGGMKGKSVEQYLKQVCGHVKAKEVHADIQLEMRSHLEELVDDKLSEGLTEAEAVQQALAQMGNPDDLGKQLHAAHKPRMEWSLAAIVAIMIGIGLLAMYSLQVAYLGQNIQYNVQLLFRKSFFTAIGIVLLVVIYFLDYRKLKKYSLYIYSGTVILLVACSIYGTTINGAKRWFTAGSFTLNVYALAAYLFLIALAGMLMSKGQAEQGKFKQAVQLVKIIVMFVLVPTLLYLQGNSFHSFIGYAFGLMIVVTYVSKSYKLFLTGAATLAVIAGSLLILMKERIYHSFERYFFFFMSSDSEWIGYQQLNVIEAVRSAGLWGNGFGVTNNKIPYLQSEMVFTHLIYSFGWVFGGAVMLLTVLFIVKAITALRTLKDSYAKGLATAMLSIIGFHFVWNIMMSFGLMPITAMNMPFISYGAQPAFLS